MILHNEPVHQDFVYQVVSHWWLWILVLAAFVAFTWIWTTYIDR